MARIVRFPVTHSIFKKYGNVGAHPQFRHARTPPAGYKFIMDQCSRGQVLSDARRALPRLIEFVSTGARQTSLSMIYKFLKTRPLRPFGDGELIFVPSFPFAIGSEPWFIEIEDLTTLFIPFIRNGATASLDVRAHAVFPLIKGLLEHPSCKGILTHVEQTKLGIEQLFDSAAISSKTCFIRVPYLPDRVGEGGSTPQRRAPGAPLRLIFNNSWAQHHSSFYVRGGVFAIEACERLWREGLPIHLTIRSRMPPEIVDRYSSFLSSATVSVIDHYLDWESYSALLNKSHVYLLPSARIHVYSLMEAMHHGLAVVTSDGWGIRDYVSPDVTGLMIPGFYGLVSWQGDNGQLNEDYRSMRQTNPGIVHTLCTALRDLARNEDYRLQLAVNGQAYVRDDRSLCRFNVEFGRFLDGIFKDLEVG